MPTIGMIRVAFYDAKAYGKPSFEQYGAVHDILLRLLETRLNEDTVELAKGCDAICVFVYDVVNAAKKLLTAPLSARLVL